MNRQNNMKDPKMENSIYMDLALIQSNIYIYIYINSRIS